MMTNEEKAKLISEQFHCDDVAYDAAEQMAEWKDQQMIEFLKEFISYHDIVTESDVEDFRKAMKGE